MISGTYAAIARPLCTKCGPSPRLPTGVDSWRLGGITFSGADGSITSVFGYPPIFASGWAVMRRDVAWRRTVLMLPANDPHSSMHDYSERSAKLGK